MPDGRQLEFHEKESTNVLLAADLLEEVVKSANVREKKKIREVLKQMDKMKTKNQLFRKLQKIMARSYKH